MTKKKLLNKVVKEQLEYRKTISMPDDIGFGFEIELAAENKHTKNEFEKDFTTDDSDVQHEYTLSSGYGLEVTTPVLFNKKDTWNKLYELGEKLKEYKGIITDGAFQVNLDDENGICRRPLEFLKLFSAYEDVIYRISKGSDIKLRRNIEFFASPCLPFFNQVEKENEEKAQYNLRQKFYRNKMYAISLKNKVIEFRTPNSTFSPWLWQNYTNIFYNLLYLNPNKVDLEKINAYLKEEKTYTLDVDKAAEFANLIFKNDLDKLYFMKQYLGNMSKDKILELI